MSAPLSPDQEAIWYEQQMQDGTSNTGAFSVTLRGPVVEAQIESACAAIIARHAALRSLVRVVDDQPTLDIRPPDHSVVIARLDVPCPPGTEIAATRAFRARNGMRYFDLTREPGIAFRLLRHGPDRRTLLVDVHHFCFDGRSKFIFARDFVAVLTALRSGAEPRLAPVADPDWMEATADAREAADRYWAVPDLMDWPRVELPCAGLPRGTATGAVGTTGDALIDGAARARLADLTAAAGTSLFGGLLACLAVQLYAYGNERMAIGVTVDSSTARSRGTIGVAVNLVPVRLTLSGDDTFTSALAAARDAVARIKEFRHVPFRRLAVARTARALVTRIALTYQRLQTDIPGISGLATDWDFTAPNSARTYDLVLQIRDADDHLVTRMDYCGDLDEVAAGAAAEQYRAVVRQVLAAPDTPLRELPLVPADSVLTGADFPLGRVIAAAGPGTVLRAGLAGTRPVGMVGAAVHPLGGECPHDPARIRAEIDERGVDTLVAPYPVARCLADGGPVPTSLRDVIVPMADLRPSPGILALVRAGVRVHAHVSDERLGLVAIETCTPDDLANGYFPALRDIAPGLRLTVRGPDGRILPRGTAGDITVEVTGEPGRFATGIRGRLDRTGVIRHLGPSAATIRHGGLALNVPEVERYLAVHPDVCEAVVVARGSRPAAYLVPRAGSGFGVREARLHLKRRGGSGQLRVAEVSVVAALPRRADGEVDRVAIVEGGWTETR